jgi:hypothetical protein
MEPHRNVERIELIAAMMPKTEYNINSENNLLLVSIDNGVSYTQLYLTPGQYLIGSNQYGNINYIADGTSTPVFGLIAELQRLLLTVDPDFNVYLATLPAANGGTGNNASPLNRVVIINSSKQFKIDFTNQFYSSGSPFRVLGFDKEVYTSSTNVSIYGNSDDGACTAQELKSGTIHAVTCDALAAIYDYNMKDDPKYIIMQLEFGNKSADRVESSDIATNQKFAVIIYDANDPDNLQTYSSTTTSGNPVTIATTRPPGTLKALKGSDFDKKILNFEPPITLENFKISFWKYDNTYYDFHNREHLLTFELDVADYDPKYRY